MFLRRVNYNIFKKRIIRFSTMEAEKKEEVVETVVETVVEKVVEKKELFR